MGKIIYNVDFITNTNQFTQTQLDIQKRKSVEEEQVEMINLLLSLKEELDIKEVIEICYYGEEDEEDA